jgi:hypothetical protein
MWKPGNLGLGSKTLVSFAENNTAHAECLLSWQKLEILVLARHRVRHDHTQIKTPGQGRIRWLTPVILATWKAEMGRLSV